MTTQPSENGVNALSEPRSPSPTLAQRIAALVPAKRALLEKEILESIDADEGMDQGIRKPPQAPDLPSFGQERLWLLACIEPDSCHHNLGYCYELKGTLDFPALSGSLQELIDRHAALRARFESGEEGPLRVVSESQCLLDLELQVISGATPEEKAAHAKSTFRCVCRRPFDLATAPLIRPYLFRFCERLHWFVLVIHHAAFDGWSAAIFARELSSFYKRRTHPSSEHQPLLEPEIQYADFAFWQREQLSLNRRKVLTDFWLEYLSEAPARLDLPSDFKRPTSHSDRGRRVFRELPFALREQLEGVGREEGGTLFMSLLAAFYVLLYRLTGKKDLVVGIPAAGRHRPEFEKVIGFFVNLHPVRCILTGDETCRELIRDVRRNWMMVMEHGDMPFELIVELLKPQRDLSRNPVVQILFAVQNMPVGHLELSGLEVTRIRRDTGVIDFDLEAYVFPFRERFGLSFNVDASVFRPETGHRWGKVYQNILEALVEAPDSRIDELPILTSHEMRNLLVGWNATLRPRAADETIHRLFERQTTQSPSLPAIIHDEGEVSFEELDQRANRVARNLTERGVEEGGIVGITLERTPDTLVVLLGILKCGSAYMPLDPREPPVRRDLMFKRSGADVVVSNRSVGDASAVCDQRHVVLEDLLNDGPSDEPGFSSRTSDPHTAAYIIHTSGSTGPPKAVPGSHRSSLNRFHWMWREYPFAEGERMAQKTNLTFVDHVWETFGPLLQGIPIVVIPDPVVSEPERLVDHLAHHQVTRIVLVPALLEIILDSVVDLRRRLPHLHYWTSSGEVLSGSLVCKFQSLLPGRVLLNLYGSSEVAADVTCYDTANYDGEGSVPIGRPIDNTLIYLLDDNQRPVPPGARGEIYVGGEGISRGYLNDRELARKRFINNPLEQLSEYAGRVYRTGDYGRYRENGEIEVLGRIDGQIKLRGIRIESGEIERALCGHPSVREAGVVLQGGDCGDKRLTAYLVMKPDRDCSSDSLSRYLRERLPAAMIPSHWSKVGQLPRLPSEKVDYKALRRLPMAKETAEPVALESDLERQIAAVFSRLLGLPAIDRRSDFFESGGHSLLAVRAVRELEKSLGSKVPPGLLFRYPSAADLALALRPSEARRSRSQAVCLQQGNSDYPLFCFPGAGGGVHGFLRLAGELGEARTVIGIESGAMAAGTPPLPIQARSSELIPELLAMQSGGPFFILGASFGGLLAWETACLLQKLGHRVSLLCLIDTYHPSYFARQKRWTTNLLHRGARICFTMKQRMRLHSRQLGNLGYGEAVSYGRGLLQKRLLRLLPYRFQNDGARDMTAVYRLRRFDNRTYRDYHPSKFLGRPLLLRGDFHYYRAAYRDQSLGWQAFASEDLEIIEVPGFHLQLLAQPSVKSVAAVLQSRLA